MEIHFKKSCECHGVSSMPEIAGSDIHLRNDMELREKQAVASTGIRPKHCNGFCDSNCAFFRSGYRKDTAYCLKLKTCLDYYDGWLAQCDDLAELDYLEEKRSEFSESMLTGFTAVIKAEDIIPPQCQACGAMWFKVDAEIE